MKQLCILFIGLFLFFGGLPVLAKDMRLDHQGLEAKKQALIDEAQAEKQTAESEAKAQAEKIRSDERKLSNAIAELKASIKSLKKENKALEGRIETLRSEEETLTKALEKSHAVNQELSAFVKSHAKELEGILIQSHQSAVRPERQAFLAPIIQQNKFFSMDDLGIMSERLFEEIDLSGQVQVVSGTMVDRQGMEQTAKILILGNFTGIYVLDDEVGFLLYSDQSSRFFALSKLPSARLSENIRAYLDGNSDTVYMDITKGGAIRQLTHELNLLEQIPKGGKLIWPILAILGLAVLIFLERVLFFMIRQTRAETLMTKVREKIAANDWEGLKAVLQARKSKLIPKVLLTAVEFRDRTRQDMENALQEAILGEIPRIERFMSTLGMLAAIAPLLGLLGTVTGMINTFHVITHYGTSDPRLMAGGISEALVTTMLGLSVAIPIMLGHTLLSRRVETLIQKMEEKSVAFVNLVFKSRNECAGIINGRSDDG